MHINPLGPKWCEVAKLHFKMLFAGLALIMADFIMAYEEWNL